MKASRSCIKKLHGALKKNGQLTTEDSRLQLDDLADRLKVLSPAVDEVASCLYPPIIHSVVYENVSKPTLLNLSAWGPSLFVCRLTYKDSSRTAKIKIFAMAVDP